ncbi:MAG: hypothetical protein ACLQME_03555 [Alphaproteobacteria bacterium]
MNLLRRTLPSIWSALVIFACFLPLSRSPSSYLPAQLAPFSQPIPVIHIDRLLSGQLNPDKIQAPYIPAQQGLFSQVIALTQSIFGQLNLDSIQTPSLLALPNFFSAAEIAMRMPFGRRLATGPSPPNLPAASPSGGVSPAADASAATVIAYLVYLVPLFAVTVIIANLRAPVTRWLRTVAGLVWLTVPFIVPFIASKFFLYSLLPSILIFGTFSDFFSGFSINIMAFGIGQWIIIFTSVCMLMNLDEII